MAVISGRSESDEQGTRTRGHTEGRIHIVFGRQAGKMGRQRPALCRLGDLPPQGVTRKSGSALCVANLRLVRADHSTLRRWRQDLASAGIGYKRAARASWKAGGREQYVRL